MISSTSRYANDNISVVTTPGRGTHQSVNHGPPSVQAVQFTWYQVPDGHTVDDMAYDLYGNGALWWMIADINPEIMDWLDLPPGTMLRVPRVG